MNERVPIVRVGKILLASIQSDLTDELTMSFQDDLSRQVVETSARGVVIDISSLEIVDSFVGRMLSTIASVTRVLDAETIVVGMRPAVAITLAELGLTLGGVRTALNADKAFEMLHAGERESLDGQFDGSAPAEAEDLGAN